MIFAFDTQSGQDTRNCIDGKQRRTSITRFIAGEIYFKSPHTGQKFWYVKLAGQKGGQQLPLALKRRFDTVSVQVVEYDDITMAQQRDIFREFSCWHDIYGSANWT